LSKNVKILPVILYVCENSSLTLNKEHRLREFENRELKRIFGPQKDEVAGGWRKLHNDELHNLCCFPNISIMIKSTRMRWAGYVARIGAKMNAYRKYVGGWIMDLKEREMGGMDWTALAQVRDQWRDLVKPSISRKYWEVLK
jgi:hypothetical protein